MKGMIRTTAKILLSLALLTACERPDVSSSLPVEGEREQRPVVYTVNFPLAWMAETLGGDAILVNFPAPPDVDPAHWQPDPETIIEYQQADRILLNGAGYAEWTRFATLSPGRLVDTTAGLEEFFVPAGDTTHTHGPDGEHEHGNVASHTWLDPSLAERQAEAVARSLKSLVAGDTERMEAALRDLKKLLQDLDVAFREAFQALGNAPVIYSHPVYQYLDARYELSGHSVVWEPGENPSDAQWDEMAALVRQSGARFMLWEAEPLPGVRERLEAMGLTLVVFQTAGNRPGQLTYWDAMRRNWLNLVRAVPTAQEIEGEQDA